MKILIDTANVEQIREMYDSGVICGATTNPTLIAREGREFGETIREILDIFGDEALVFAEAVSLESGKMVEEARELAKLSPKIVVKIPMCREGLKAVREQGRNLHGCDVGIFTCSGPACGFGRRSLCSALCGKAGRYRCGWLGSG